MSTISIFAYFYGGPDDPLDKACRHIFEAHGGKSRGSGMTTAGPADGERDLQYDVPIERADECRVALKKAGFRLQPTPDRALGIPDNAK
jgi:hypothetical protein